MLRESIRVLIVDGAPRRDEPVDELLAAAGFETRVVSDSRSAAGWLDVWKPAVAVVDLRHPASEARQFCADLADRPSTELAVVLIAEMPNLLKPLPIVPDGLVTTPIDPALLTAAVHRAAQELTALASESADPLRS